MESDSDDTADAHRPDDLPPPPSLRAERDGYELLEEIGSGATGVVYRARDRKLGRTVALKLLRAGALAGEQQRARFLREARAGAGMQHPGIVQVFEVGEHEGCPYLALEYVAGATLARRLAGGPMALREAAALVEHLARALDFAHTCGVVHRDLKPANVLMPSADANGDLANPKIADFGLARLSEATLATEVGTVLGTPAYMAPEQAAGRGADAGPPADIYALGAILYECLTGHPPFQAPTPLETLRRVLSDEPTAPSLERSGVARDLDTICLTCLNKEPLRRYSSATAMADDLRRYLDGRPIQARPVSAWEQVWRWTRRNPRVAALGALLAVALAATAFQWRRSQQMFELAEGQRVAAEGNLSRYRQAADDFAGLLNDLDTDQLFHLRWAPLRRELVVPALERNRAFIRLSADDTLKRAEVVRARFRVAMLTRLLSNDVEPETRLTALEAGREALAALDAFAIGQPDVVQNRRDRAALTHNLGYLLHASGNTVDALPVLASACRQRQELLDEQPDNLDYRSELAGCWNDRGMVLFVLRRFAEAVSAHDRAIELHVAVLEAAPQVPRYRKFLCNHHFNRAMALRDLARGAEAVAAISEGCRLLPLDPEQWHRKARILASVSGGPDAAQAAILALRRSIELGIEDAAIAIGHHDLVSIRTQPEYIALVKEIEQKKRSAMSQHP